MQLESHDHLKDPVRIKSTRVVIYDDFGNPLALAVEVRPGFIYLSTQKDPEFQDYLYNLGIKNTTIVKTIDTKNIPKLK